MLLKKLGLLDHAIDYAMESGAFAQAFELTRAGNKLKLPEVHLKCVLPVMPVALSPTWVCAVLHPSLLGITCSWNYAGFPGL